MSSIIDILLKPFAWLLLVLYNFVGNYGIALFIFALIVKLILFPVALKGKRGMIQMNMMSGKMQKLQKQYGADKERYNAEVQKLYEKENVNPMGGCLWTMVPLFILLPLYSIIRQPLHHLMGLNAEQIATVAQNLNWENVALSMGWIKEAAPYATGAYNELFLASLINEGNLQAVQAAVGESTKVFAMNFSFLGMDLSQIPTWKFWANGMDWTTIGLFLLVVVSAVTGLIFSRVSMKTNAINQQSQNTQAAQQSKMMMWMTPLMSIWIGFMMPGLLCLYWIANNILSMGQEFVCSKMLKKDYEEAARQQAENEAREKEEEKQRKREAAERRALEAEEAKKNKKAAKKKDEPKQDRAVTEVSRVGLRSYARGRAYDPNRFGGVTEYKDPSSPVDEAALEKALSSKEKRKEKAAISAALEDSFKPAQEEVQAPQTGEAAQIPPVEESAAPAPEAEPAAEQPAEETAAFVEESFMEETPDGDDQEKQ